MSPAPTDLSSQNTSVQVQVDPHTRKVPHSVRRLADLAYLEQSIHRLLCGWGNQFDAWEDKVALCAHVWDQACIVQSLRQRIDQFPGAHADQPVSHKLEALANTVLNAPCFEDAVDGIYQVLNTALVNAYLDFIEKVSAIHDGPTHQIIRQIVATKDRQRRWRVSYRQRVVHHVNQNYLEDITAQLASLDHLHAPIPMTDTQAAAPVGVHSSFRPMPAKVDPSWLTTGTHDILDWIAVDFADQIQARQLFWPIGYMRELGLAMDQLLWIYDSPDMPWAFAYDESRHLWDESRHGDSGYARMKELGITIQEVGFKHSRDLLGDRAQTDDGQRLAVMSPKALYEALFFIGMVAETGHFKVKREAYSDFKAGGDLASAEMMLYDIIDETMHVQYAHQWLGRLAERAGLEHEGYEQRAHQIREDKQTQADQRVAALRQDPNKHSDPSWQLYQQLRQRVHECCPLSNAQSCPSRSSKPM